MMEYKFQIAELLIRVFTGVLFLFQGYDKLFRVKVKGVIEVFTNDAERYRIPRPLLVSVSYFTSLVEFLGGAFLLLGLFNSYALYFLGVDLLVVSVAFTYMTPMWDMRYVFPRFALVATLLLLPEHYHYFTLDHLLFSK